MKKRSFFERLTGSVNIDDDELDYEESEIPAREQNKVDMQKESRFAPKSRGSINHSRDDDKQLASTWNEELAGEGELSLDVHQTPDDIIVRTMIPGVKKDDMDISISRDSITIKGSRKEDQMISDDDYVVRELYWGSFSRTVKFPHEVDIEHAEATESQGMLTIKLPRIDKDRQAKLRIKSI
jgi:HSP20 family protein